MEILWGDRVGIRPLGVGDAIRLRRFMLQPDVHTLLFEEQDVRLPSAASLGLQIGLNRLSGRPDFGIVDRAARLIGHIRLWRVSEHNRSAMLSIYIGEPDQWGKGLGTEALQLVLEQALGPMGLLRIELHVFDFNTRAIRSYEKVGFHREGVRRQALLRGRDRHDIIVMGILKDEFWAGIRQVEGLNQDGDRPPDAFSQEQ